MDDELLEGIVDDINRLGCIYDIHFCRAGVGFIMYYPEKCQTLKMGEGDWREGLAVERYYSTLREAAIETRALLLNARKAGGSGCPKP